MLNDLTRRKLLTAASTGLVATRAARATDSGKRAVLGGSPLRTAPFPSWPVITENEERAWMKVLRGGKWNRLDGDCTRQFEEAWAARLGAKHCLATANGTSALIISLNALGIGPGDEVIVPPYTFVATVNAVLMQHAMPVFVDSDPETFQIDARKIEAAITERTDASCRCTWAGRRRIWTRFSRSAGSTACRCWKTPARRIWRNGVSARSVRSEHSDVSASRRPRI
jgi:perosamine synthetase